MNTVAIVSTTGGAGRSTLTAELASLLAQRKHPALALECDPANVLGFHFGMRDSRGWPRCLSRRTDPWRVGTRRTTQR
jgi:cellulose biosynthesis protein BcsQ